jgi:hypothetical protein
MGVKEFLKTLYHSTGLRVGVSLLPSLKGLQNNTNSTNMTIAKDDTHNLSNIR